MTFEKQKQPKKKGIAHTNDATLAQGNQMTNLILQKKTPAKNLQQLLASGLQSMLLDACNESNIATVDPFAFRKVLGLNHVDIMPYGATHNLDVDNPNISEIDEFIYYHLHRWFDFDHLKLLIRGFANMQKAVSGKTNVRLYAVNRDSISEIDDAFGKNNIRQTNLKELVKFAYLNPMLEGWISATIIATGSVARDPYAEEGKIDYPFIRYEHGGIKECGRFRGDKGPILNGFPGNNHRFFFLGSKM
jgi:hypothetical protein